MPVFDIFSTFDHIPFFQDYRLISLLLIISISLYNDQYLGRTMFVPVQGGVGLKGCFCDVIAQFAVIVNNGIQPSFPYVMGVRRFCALCQIGVDLIC